MNFEASARVIESFGRNSSVEENLVRLFSFIQGKAEFWNSSLVAVVFELSKNTLKIPRVTAQAMIQTFFIMSERIVLE